MDHAEFPRSQNDFRFFLCNNNFYSKKADHFENPPIKKKRFKETCTIHPNTLQGCRKGVGWEITITSQLLASQLKLIYYEKSTKFCEISTLLLCVYSVDESKVEISQKFVAFSEYVYEPNPFLLTHKVAKNCTSGNRVSGNCVSGRPL